MKRKLEHEDETKETIKSDENTVEKPCDYCIKGGEQIRKEMKSIARILEEQNKLLKKELLRKQEPALIQHRELKFPIKTEEQLIAFDQEITAQNRDFYVESLRTQIRSDVKNNLHYVLSLPLIHDYNVHGVHDKKRLKDHDEFYYALLDAIETPQMAHRAERLLQKAILYQKRRYHKQLRRISNPSTNNN